MILTKDTIAPGYYRKGKDAWHVTDDDVKEMHESVLAIKEAGYRQPIWMDHPEVEDKTAYPISMADTELIKKAEEDLYFLGWLDGGKLGDKNLLSLQLDVSDEIGTKLSNKKTYVSPQYGPFQLPDGRIIKKAIHHLAVVRNPVNKRQSGDFKIDESKQSMKDLKTLQMSEALSQGVVRFSMSDAVPEDAGPQTNNTTSVPNSNDLITRLKDSLQAMGIQIAPDSPILQDPESLSRVLQMLISATTDANSKVTSGAASGTPGSQNPNEQATVIAMADTPTTTTTTPVVNNDERIVQMSQTIVGQQNMIDQLLAEATQGRKTGYLTRIDQLQKTGRIRKEKADAFRAEVQTYQFSATAANTPSMLDIRLKDAEELPEGAVMSPTEKIVQFGINETKVGEISSFFNGDGDVSDERVNEIMNEYCPRTEKLAHSV